jgi:glucose/arabinose dehydrogenase
MRAAVLLALALSPLACHSSSSSGGGSESDGGDAAPPQDATADVKPVDGAPTFDVVTSDVMLGGDPCNTPGTVQFGANGMSVVGGGAPPASLSFLTLPAGFCAHFYGNVGNARQLKFAPGGELFVASPTTGTTGGGPNGLASIVVLPDDGHTGNSDTPVTFLSGLASTQGMLFTAGYFYYQDGTMIRRMPYTSGQRMGQSPGDPVVNVTIYEDATHWPKTLDVADDGTIYVGNGGDQGETCIQPPPFHGGILKLDGSEGGAPVAQGFRNPIAVRCSHGHNLCFALELALDYSAGGGGREKMVPIRQGDDWGFPCCATTNAPYPDISPVPDCSSVATDEVSWLIGDTPFGLEFEPGLWPAPWAGVALVATHGAAGTWVGARIVAISLDPVTGLPVPGNDLNGNDTGAMSDFATGWDDGSYAHGRPAALTFSADGRLFVANDRNGDILWIAPMGL